MKTGCKFRVESVSPLDEQGNEHVTLVAVNEPGRPGDVSFSKDAPHGSVRLSVTNPAVIGQIKRGDSFIVTIETA